MDERDVTRTMPRVIAWLVGAWIVAAALLASSAWGAHVGRTIVKPLPLTVDRPDMVLLTIGDSQTAGRYPVPPSGTSEILSDSSIAVSTVVPFIYPNAAGVRLGIADTARFVNYLEPFESTLKPTERMLSKVRYYAQSHEWTARLAHLIGTNYWYSIAWDGTGLTDCWGTGAAANDYEVAAENWGWDNVAAATADIIIIKLGINDANTGQCDTAANIIATYPTLIDKLYEINPDVKILLLGIQPFGSSSSHASSNTIARADSLESWITGRAPYYNDSTGAKQSALGRYAAKAARGQFSTYSYAYRFVSYNTTNADTTRSACSDTTLTALHDGAYLHFSWRGEQLHAQHMARDVFGCSLPDGADTTDVGDWPTPLFTREAKTVYVNTATGDNYGNWLDPFSSSRPLATLNAGCWRAGPGATVEFGAGDYGTTWWTMAGGQYFRPSVYQRGEQDRIILDGNGVAEARITTANTAGFSNTPTITSMPDSLLRAYYTFKNWRFVGDGVRTLFTLVNTTGIRFEECEFDSMDTIYRSAESGTPAITDPLTVAFDNCTILSWGEGAGQSGIYPSGSANYQFQLDFTNNAVIDTIDGGGGTKNRGLIRMGGTATGSTSSMRLNFTGNDVRVGDLGTAPVLSAVTDCDAFIVNNKFRFSKNNTTATAQLMASQADATAGTGDTLWFYNNIVEIDTTRNITSLLTWCNDAEYVDRNLVKKPSGTVEIVAQSDSRGTTFKATDYSATGDTIIFGGRPLIGKSGWPSYDITDLDIEHGRNHASIGPTQYTGDPIMWTGNYPGRQTYQDMTPWKGLQLINNGVLPAVTATDHTTYYEIPRTYNESDGTVVETWLDAWRNWPSATREKMQYRFSSTTMNIQSADSTYNGPAQLIASLAAGNETACDSTDASTWFVFPRPYNLTDKLQLLHWLDYQRGAGSQRLHDDHGLVLAAQGAAQGVRAGHAEPHLFAGLGGLARLQAQACAAGDEMIGNRKLILSLSVLAVGAVLAWGGHLTSAAVEVCMWTLVAGVGGNVGEHFARAKRGGE